MKKPRSKSVSSSAAEFINQRIYDLRAKRSQLQIARAAGFKSPNMLSMLKDGKAKLPLERVIALAKALECDAGHLMRLALEQTLTQPVLDEIFAHGPTSENERAILTEIRRLSANSDPALTKDVGAALAHAFSGKPRPSTSRSKSPAPAGHSKLVSAAAALEIEAKAAQRELNFARQFSAAAESRIDRVESRIKAIRVQLDCLIRGS